MLAGVGLRVYEPEQYFLEGPLRFRVIFMVPDIFDMGYRVAEFVGRRIPRIS